MKSVFVRFYLITICTILFIFQFNIPAAYAWSDSAGGRRQYTVEEINNGALGAIQKGIEGYPGIIVFNSIEDVDGSEFNFLSAQEDKGKDEWHNTWQGNNITVEDGKEYYIRLYVHNNNPNGRDAIAEDVTVSVVIPRDISNKIVVNGFITSSNAIPQQYEDYVNFISDIPFHLEYIEGSTQLFNNSIGKGGLELGDEVITNDGILIGFDALDGKIPGCYYYDNYILLKVRAVFDHTMESSFRLCCDDNNYGWTTSSSAEIGDEIEFRTIYIYKGEDINVSPRVLVSYKLPSGLKYISGSTTISTRTVKSKLIKEDDIVNDGIDISSYISDESPAVNISIKASVVPEGLGEGYNFLISHTKVKADNVILQTHTETKVQNIFLIKRIVFIVGIISFLFLLYQNLFVCQDN